MLKDKLEVINWKERSDFPWRKAINSRMLQEGGESHIERCKLYGEPKSARSKVREIIYDQDYVARKIARDVFTRLNADPSDYAKTGWIIGAAWDFYCWSNPHKITGVNHDEQI